MSTNLREFTFNNRNTLGTTDMIISRVSITMGKHYHDTPVGDLVEDLLNFLKPKGKDFKYENNWHRPVVISYMMMVYSGTRVLEFTRDVMESVAKESDRFGKRKYSIIRLCQIIVNEFEPESYSQPESLNSFESNFKKRLESLTDINSKLMFAGFILYSLTLDYETKYYIGEPHK